MTGAHSSEVVIQFHEAWPEHEPRRSDPHYKFFVAAKARLKKAGLLVCNVTSAHHYGVIELHHAAVEYAHINDIDINKLNEVWGLHLTDEQFLEFVEGQPFVNADGKWINGLEPLCTEHHRGVTGIHSLPGPDFTVVRSGKDSITAFNAYKNTEIPIQPAP